MLFPKTILTCSVVALALLSACTDSVTSPPLPNPGIDPTNVDVAYCTGLEPSWVAFQDGDGAWKRAESIASGSTVRFRQTLAANRGAIATVRLFAHGLTVLSVQYGTPAELTIVGDTNPVHCGPVISTTLLGTVAGIDTNEVAVVSAGFGPRAVAFPAEGNSFVLGGLITGPQDILATRSTRENGIVTLTRVILRRNPELPDSATIPVLDFGSPEAFAPVIANVTLVGLGAEGATSSTQLRTANSDGILTFLTSSATAATRTYYAVPEARLQQSDLQVLSATANPTSGSSIRSTALYFRSPVDQTLTLGAPIIAPTFGTVATTPALRLRAQLAQQTDYDCLTTVSLQQGQTVVNVSMTSTYAALTGGGAGYDLIVPDLSSAAGFDARWALRSGESVFWTASRTGGTLGLGQNAVPTNGSTVRTAIGLGTLAP